MKTTKEETIEMTQVRRRLSADLKQAAKKLNTQEARYLVDTYYQHQDNRKRSNNQMLSLGGEPSRIFEWLGELSANIEYVLKQALRVHAAQTVQGKWLQSVYGIGPVISAGLLAHIDIEKAPTVGHIWRFAGLDPTVKWDKGCKRPWNAQLKSLCWKIGQSFMKFSNRDDCYYGKVYQSRKAFEIMRNDAGDLKHEAERALSEKKYNKSTEAYKAYVQSKLPPAHLDARARRWTVKMFLRHFHCVWYETHFGEKVPAPSVIEMLGHARLTRPPNWPMR